MRSPSHAKTNSIRRTNSSGNTIVIIIYSKVMNISHKSLNRYTQVQPNKRLTSSERRRQRLFLTHTLFSDCLTCTRAESQTCVYNVEAWSNNQIDTHRRKGVLRKNISPPKDTDPIVCVSVCVRVCRVCLYVCPCVCVCPCVRVCVRVC